jgi:hypothetical protein
MQEIQFYYGLSSLLYIISAYKILHSELNRPYKLFSWFLVASSFLCNSTNYSNILYLQFDYLMISIIAISYINSYKINTCILFIMINEAYFLHTLQGTSQITSLYALYKISENITTRYVKWLILGIFGGIISYSLRYYYDIYCVQYIFVNTIWHLSSMCVNESTIT